MVPLHVRARSAPPALLDVRARARPFRAREKRSPRSRTHTSTRPEQKCRYYDITPPSPTALLAERERADASRFLATLRRFHDGTDVPNYHYYHQLAFLSAPTRGGDACRSRNGGAGAAWRARCPLKLVRFDFIGHVETIGEDWPVVERHLREPAGSPRRLRARARDGAASRDTSLEPNATRAAVPHLRAHGDDKPAASFVNQTAVAAVVCSYLRTDYACLATECVQALGRLAPGGGGLSLCLTPSTTRRAQVRSTRFLRIRRRRARR